MGKRWSIWAKGLVLGAGLLVIAAACGSDPTATPPATNTPTLEPTATATPAPGETPQPTETPRPTPTPSGFDLGSYLEGKTIRIVANSSPGGGTDAQGRVMAAYLSRNLPGNPRVVFTNQPSKPLAYVYAAEEAPKDGTYIAWDSTPQLNFGFDSATKFIKRSTFQFIGSTIDATRSFTTYDPVRNLGAAAADKCLWDFEDQDGTGGGRHNAFYLAEEISDVVEGAPVFLATAYAMEQLGTPFRYFAFDTVDTNAVLTMWARGDINSTVRASLWYRIPLEQPDWIPNGLMRVYAGMGPGELKANAQSEPHCGYVGEHLNEEQLNVYQSIMNPTNYLSKALWLPPGTPDEIADAMSEAIRQAFANDAELVERYGAIAGEDVSWVERDDGQQQTLDNEALFEGAQEIVERERTRLLEKYFPEYL